VEVVEEPLGGRRDERAVADVFGEGAIGVFEDARVVAQARVDAARAAAPGIDGEIRREGERPLFEPLGAERFFAKRLIASPAVSRPVME
jgi:hypothetical protein